MPLLFVTMMFSYEVVPILTCVARDIVCVLEDLVHVVNDIVRLHGLCSADINPRK